jgi:Beta-ketoacyl synthase, N-terminal domain
MHAIVEVNRHREDDMSADEVRLRIEEPVSLIASIAVDRISDDARSIEDLGLDSLSIIASLVVGQEFRGGRRRAVTPVARPVPPDGGERGCGVRPHRRLGDGHTHQRSSRDLGGQAGLHTISRLDCQEVREGPAYARPIDFASTVVNAPSGRAAIRHGLRAVNKAVATGASSGPEAIGSTAGAVRTGVAARVPAGAVEVISPEVLLASDKAGLLCGRTHHPRRSTWAVAARRRRRARRCWCSREDL